MIPCQPCTWHDPLSALHLAWIHDPWTAPLAYNRLSGACACRQHGMPVCMHSTCLCLQAIRHACLYACIALARLGCKHWMEEWTGRWQYVGDGCRPTLRLVQGHPASSGSCQEACEALPVQPSLTSTALLCLHCCACTAVPALLRLHCWACTAGPALLGLHC
jgi:hypothetical protein